VSPLLRDFQFVGSMQPGTAGNCAKARLQAAAVLHWNIHFCNGGNLANFNGSKRKKR